MVIGFKWYWCEETQQVLKFESSQRNWQSLTLEDSDGNIETFNVGESAVIGVFTQRVAIPVDGKCDGFSWRPEEGKTDDAGLFWVRYEDQKYDLLAYGKRDDIQCSNVRSVSRDELLGKLPKSAGD